MSLQLTILPSFIRLLRPQWKHKKIMWKKMNLNKLKNQKLRSLSWRALRSSPRYKKLKQQRLRREAEKEKIQLCSLKFKKNNWPNKMIILKLFQWMNLWIEIQSLTRSASKRLTFTWVMTLKHMAVSRAAMRILQKSKLIITPECKLKNINTSK